MVKLKCVKEMRKVLVRKLRCRVMDDRKCDKKSIKGRKRSNARKSWAEKEKRK